MKRCICHVASRGRRVTALHDASEHDLQTGINDLLARNLKTLFDFHSSPLQNSEQPGVALSVHALHPYYIPPKPNILSSLSHCSIPPINIVGSHPLEKHEDPCDDIGFRIEYQWSGSLVVRLR